MSDFLACDRFRVSFRSGQVEMILKDSGYMPVMDIRPSYSGSEDNPERGHFQREGIYVEVVPVVVSKGARRENGGDQGTLIYLGVKYVTGRTGPLDKSPSQVMDEAMADLKSKLHGHRQGKLRV